MIVDLAVNGRLGLRAAAWIQAKGRERRLRLPPRLYASPVCDDSAAEAAYAAVLNLTFTFYLKVGEMVQC